MKTKFISIIVLAMLIFSYLTAKSEKPVQKLHFFVNQGLAIEQLIMPEKEISEEAINNSFGRSMVRSNLHLYSTSLHLDISTLIKPEEEIEEQSIVVGELYETSTDEPNAAK